VPHLAKTALSPGSVQKLNIVSNEDNFRQMQEDSGALLRQLPAVRRRAQRLEQLLSCERKSPLNKGLRS